ncbi:MAG TPA: hydroxysqualene dehydroxylase HpnE [Candidatus Binatia bacterium]|nr:hydroxysqualene dehydroxylase HpnE [Candidatus Binatia bacterium]
MTNGAPKHVAVVGGGFAGLAAGVELAERGFRVTVLEARGHLGGRAYSFRDEATGTTVDNGQHAMMGCYARALSFLDRIGAGSRITRQRDLRVPMRHRTRGRGVIRCAPLPAPLHLAGGVLGYRLLARRERLGALLAGARMMRMRAKRDRRLAELTIDELLVSLGQSENARRSFWHPVAVATCNEAPERAAAAPFAEVVARAFFASRSDSQFVFARVGLSELYTGAAQAFIEARGGRVALRAPVDALEVAGERVAAARLRDGTSLAADAVVCAVPPRALAGLLPPALAADRSFRRIGDLGASPIVSVHLWFDRPVLGDDFVGLVGTTTQWVFDRARLGIDAGAGEGSGAGGGSISAVISAARDVVERDGDEVARTAVEDIRALVPDARRARLEKSLVVKEKEATIALTPAAEALRPMAWTPIRNLAIAGDWTATGLPATIESAVVSAGRAVALVEEELR